MNRNQALFLFLALIVSIPFEVASQSNSGYDIVLEGGRVIDPETGLDGVRNVGIMGNRIADISQNKMAGKRTINASGLVVSPGFIDLHVHGQTNKAHQYQVRDGVTTALELEGGIPFIEHWIDSKRGNSLVNYGASVAHAVLRVLPMVEDIDIVKALNDSLNANGWSEKLAYQQLDANVENANNRSLTETELKELDGFLKTELNNGALGIGIPVGYYPGATGRELLKVYQISAKYNAPIFSHTRGFGLPGINEAIANATVTGAPLHIVHINSLSLGEIDVSLDMIASAQAQGLDITTELYPYTAASTHIQSVLFDEGWQETLGISYGDLQWEATGERLTESTFKKYRKQGGVIIIHMMKPEWIEMGIKAPFTIIASDGMAYAPGAHPRTAGTFSKVLGQYVRENNHLSLNDALAKMTIMPARRLEAISPAMRSKGRLQIGADADITIFSPEKIIDKADFSGMKYSEGIEYVLVNGVIVVNSGKSVEGVFPGRPVLGKYKN